MSNKSKLLKNISIISVVFLVFIAMFGIKSIAATKSIKNADDLRDLMDAASTDAWYEFAPDDYIGKKIEDKNDTINDPQAYCIDPHTGHSGYNYHIVNIIDINDAAVDENPNTVTVYGEKEAYKNGKPFKISNENVRPYLMAAYLANKCQENPIPISGGTSYKDALARLFWDQAYVNKMRKAGLSDYIKARGSGYAPKSNKYIAEAIKEANKIANQSIPKKGYMKENMTDEQKANVSYFVKNGKTYIGPYKITLNDCKVAEIKVNDKITADGITTDLKNYSNVKDVSETPSNKEFYIVVNKEIEKVTSIKLTGSQKIIGVRARLMILSGGLAQNYIVYRSTPSKTPVTLELEVPEKGKIQIIKKDALGADINLEGIGFKLYNTKRGWVRTVSGKITYVDHFDRATKYETDKNGKLLVDNLAPGTYKIFEVSLPKDLEKYYKIGTWNVPIFGSEEREKKQALAIKNTKTDKYTYKVKAGQTAEIDVKNKRAYTSLKIKKVDSKDSNMTLTGIKFRLYKLGNDAGWVTVKKNTGTSTITSYEYTGVVPDSEYDTNTDILDLMVLSNETPTVEKLPVGTYQVYEIDLGPYTDKYTLGEFSVDGGKTYHKGDRKGEAAVGANKQGLVTFTVKNTQNPKEEKISIKGYVWLDVVNGKNATGRDNKYYKDDKETDRTKVDQLMEGITVELVDITTGNVEQTAVTDANGAYRFDNVSIDKLSDYIVRFVYDGYTYQDVISDYNEVEDLENTSKAVENKTRTNLNDLFNELEGEGQKLSDGTILNYEKVGEDEAQLTDNTLKSLPKVQANTQNGYIKKCYDKDTSVEVIENINLGLYKRDMPDLTIQKDIDSAQLSINGKKYTYHYNRKLTGNSATETPIGVDFDDDYSLPVYEADVEYNPEGTGKGLEAVTVYKIKLQNTSTNLYTTVKGIKEAFAKNYEFIPGEIYLSDSNVFDEKTAKKIELDKDKSKIKDDNSDYYYGELVFEEPIKLGPLVNVDGQRAYSNTQFIYLKLKIKNIDEEYELAKDSFEEPDKTKSNLKNIVEITRYSVYSDANCENSYAGVDRTSIPNNLDLGTYKPNEDDNDKAPGLRIVDAGARTLSGTVFEDDDDDGLTGVNQQRIGNGKFDDGEKTIAGVQVKLVDENGNDVQVYNGKNTVTTDENGNFAISGFIPGDYKLEFTWGDQKGDKKVADYKATIYKAPSDWFTNNTEKYSVAMDNWETREAIDAYELKNIGSKISEMKSTTNKFEVGIENSTSNEALGIGDKFNNAKFIYTLNNADFGIIERPRQSLDIDKKVTSIKVTTDQGQTVADAKIENGKLNVKTGASYISGGEDLGYIWLQIDKSITQAMTAKIGYTIIVANNSEVDYANKDYYNYGTIPENKTQMSLKADAIYDYMKGENLSSEEGLWKTISISEYENELKDYVGQQTITERSFISQADTFEKDEFNKIKTIGNWKTGITQMQSIYNDWVEKLDTLDTTTVRSVKLAERDIAEYSKEDDRLTKLMQPGDSESVEIMTSKLISNGDDIRFDNDAEIADITFETDQIVGRKPSALTSKTYDRAGWVSITPATGEDKDYTPIIITTVSAIAVLGIGVIFIKKKILK